MTKRDLRNIFLRKRDTLSKTEVESASLNIMQNLSKDIDFKRAKSVMAYMPIRNEVNPLIDFNIYKDKMLAIPKVIGNELIPCIYKEPFSISKYGIKEPIVCEKTDVELCLVPGVCFDKHLYRIGFGKGYYDRFLQKHKNIFSIGICYDFQIIDDVKHEFHDVKLNKIISENYVIEGGYRWNLSL